MIWVVLAGLLTGCAANAPVYYYCQQIVLIHPEGRRVDALECVPKMRQVPWNKETPKDAIPGS